MTNQVLGFLIISQESGKGFFGLDEANKYIIQLFNQSHKSILASKNFKIIDFLKPRMKRYLPKCLCNGNLERRVQVHHSDIHQYLSRSSNKTNQHVKKKKKVNLRSEFE